MPFPNPQPTLAKFGRAPLAQMRGIRQSVIVGGMRWAPLFYATSILVATAPTFAQTVEARYALAWVRGAGAEDCPAAAELQREVERRIGHSVFDSAAPLSIEVSVRRDESGTTASRRSEIHVRGAEGQTIGQRVLFSNEPDCRSLFSSTALAIALLVDPEATEQRQAQLPKPLATPSSVSPSSPAASPTNLPPAASQFAGDRGVAASTSSRLAPVDVAPEQTKEQPTTQRASTIETKTRPAERFAQLVASAVGSTSIIPKSSIGVGIGMRAWESTSVGWSLSALYLPSQQGGTVNGASVAVGLIALQPALMLGYRASERWRVTVELGGAIGALHHAARGGSGLGPTELPFLSARAELGLQLMLGKIAFLEFGGAGLVPLFRARMTDSSGKDVLFVQPALGATGRIGLGIQFP